MTEDRSKDAHAKYATTKSTFQQTQNPSLNNTSYNLELPLIHLHTVDDPVRLLECSRVSGNIVGALSIFCRIVLVTARLLPEIILSSIVSAECGIEDDIVLLEMVIDDAVSSFSCERRSSPCRGIWLATLDVCWYCRWRERPHLDEFCGPFHSDDSTSIGIEGRSVVAVSSSC